MVILLEAIPMAHPKVRPVQVMDDPDWASSQNSDNQRQTTFKTPKMIPDRKKTRKEKAADFASAALFWLAPEGF